MRPARHAHEKGTPGTPVTRLGVPVPVFLSHVPAQARHRPAHRTLLCGHTVPGRAMCQLLIPMCLVCLCLPVPRAWHSFLEARPGRPMAGPGQSLVLNSTLFIVETFVISQGPTKTVS